MARPSSCIVVIGLKSLSVQLIKSVMACRNVLEMPVMTMSKTTYGSQFNSSVEHQKRSPPSDIAVKGDLEWSLDA